MWSFEVAVVLTVVTSFAVQASAQVNETADIILTNPVTRFGNYSLPDQEWPGLQSAWSPAPDSGEVSYVGSGRLRGRKALITGGDSGIGRAVAIAYAREGADVAINYLENEQSDADTVESIVRAAGRQFFRIPGDLRNESFCADLVSQANNALGGLDILVSNAAFSNISSDITELSTEQLRQTFETNVYPSFWLARNAVPLLLPGSSIIITASGVARGPPPTLLDYAASKAAGANFARGLARQLVPRGIRVNAVAPNMAFTNFLTSQGATNASVDQYRRTVPYGRIEQAVELAPLFVTLADHQNSYASGQVWGADGGTGDF